MGNFIITKNKEFFKKIGDYNYCNLEEMELPEVIAYDSETSGLDYLTDTVFSIQLGTGKNNYLIDLQEHNNSLFVKDKQIFIQEVFSYLKDKTLIFHNALFDLSFLYRAGFYPDKIYDTMIASKILYNGDRTVFSHSFGSVMLRELKIKYDKSEQENINKVKLTKPSYIAYCFQDVDKLSELHQVLYSKLYEYDSLTTYKTNCDFVLAIAYMKLCGLPIDKNYWKSKMEIDDLNNRKQEQLIIEYIYDNLPKYRYNQLSLFEEVSKKINVQLSSVKQMIPIFKNLGINVKTDDDKESIEENVINKSNHEFVSMWLKYKQFQHRITTFGESILNKIRYNHIYSDFNTIVDTGRMVSRKGEINFLNLPSDKETRDCFRAMKGYKMIGCDYDS